MFEKLVSARNNYNYPAIGLCSIRDLDIVSKWQDYFKKNQFATTLELDNHHHKLLLSEHDSEVLLGIYSVIYWGYITSGAKSVTRCDWLSVGNAKNNDHSLSYHGKDYAVNIIRESKKLLDKSDYVGALLEIRKLPHIGVSFGTKLLAFIDPENVGVLDEKILRHLSTGSFCHVLEETVIVRLNKKNNSANKFQDYCESLNVIKIQLNNKGFGWCDVSGAKLSRFRAIDVERALFSIAKSIDNA